MKRKVILRLLLALALLLVAGVWTVTAQRNRVVMALISEVNKEIKGRIEFDEVHITGVGRWPEVALRVNDIVLHQTSEVGARDTVAYIQYMYVGIPISSIWTSDFTIEDVYFEGGRLVLVDEWSGKLSIEEAIALNQPFTERSDEDRGKNPLLLSIDSVHARNFEFIYRADRFKDELKLRIERLDAEFKQHGDSTIASARVITRLEEQFDREDDLADRERFEGRIQVIADVVVTKNDLRISQIDLLASQLLYHSDSSDLTIDSVSLRSPELYYPLRSGPFFNHFKLDGIVSVDHLNSGPYALKETNFKLEVDNGIYSLNPGTLPLSGTVGSGFFRIRPFDEIPSYSMLVKIDSFDVRTLMNNAFDSIPFYGSADLLIDLETRGIGEALYQNLNGQVRLEGKDLTLTDVDIDKFVRKFKRSQNFNLVDVGAVIVAGPIGLAATKGGAYANLALFSKGDTTLVAHLLSSMEIQQGRVSLVDVAMSTLETRIAGTGYVNLSSDTIDLSIDVVNRVGCSLVGQQVYGTIQNVERSKVKIVKTLLGPIENFLKDVSIVDCKPVYQGSVAPPPTKAELSKIERAAKKAAKKLSD